MIRDVSRQYCKVGENDRVTIFRTSLQHKVVTLKKGTFSTKKGIEYSPSLREVAVHVPIEFAETFDEEDDDGFCRLKEDLTTDKFDILSK